MAAAAILVFGFGNMHVFRFREFGLKMPIHAKKRFFWRIWLPKWGAMWTNPKRHILARVRVVWAIMRENTSTGLTCEFLKKGHK